jgi:hypothetical protein
MTGISQQGCDIKAHPFDHKIAALCQIWNDQMPPIGGKDYGFVTPSQRTR